MFFKKLDMSVFQRALKNYIPTVVLAGQVASWQFDRSRSKDLPAAIAREGVEASRDRLRPVPRSALGGKVAAVPRGRRQRDAGGAADAPEQREKNGAGAEEARVD